MIIVSNSVLMNQCKWNPSKPITSCLKPDELGFIRPIFLDRLCDGKPDCFNGEDEGELAKCKVAGEPTPNGCGRFPIFEAIIESRTERIECIYNGNSNDSGWFSNRRKFNANFDLLIQVWKPIAGYDTFDCNLNTYLNYYLYYHSRKSAWILR